MCFKTIKNILSEIWANKNLILYYKIIHHDQVEFIYGYKDGLTSEHLWEEFTTLHN